jgi:hypothetical protein
MLMLSLMDFKFSNSLTPIDVNELETNESLPSMHIIDPEIRTCVNSNISTGLKLVEFSLIDPLSWFFYIL